MSLPRLTYTAKVLDILKRSDFFSDQALHRSSFHHFAGQAYAKKTTLQTPGGDKAVKCREDGVTRYVAGYTVFFLCGELFRYL